MTDWHRSTDRKKTVFTVIKCAPAWYSPSARARLTCRCRAILRAHASACRWAVGHTNLLAGTKSQTVFGTQGNRVMLPFHTLGIVYIMYRWGRACVWSHDHVALSRHWGKFLLSEKRRSVTAGRGCALLKLSIWPRPFQ